MGKSKKRSNRKISQEWETLEIRCVCGDTDEGNDPSVAWINCNKCGVWQHKICMGIGTFKEQLPKIYKCEKCAPEAHQELLETNTGDHNLREERHEAHEPRSAGGKKKVKKDRSNGSEKQKPKGPKTVNSDMATKCFPLTEKCHHYTRRGDVDWDIQKYWDQRYSIFSRYDEGIFMTDDAWFGVTPEPVANKVAEDLISLTPTSKTVVIDIFAGAAGNSIAFALSSRFTTIIAIEKDPSVIACAQNNARIYGVSEKITWINDDCFTYLSSHTSEINPSTTVVFASPPWGGPGYSSSSVFNLNTMEPYSIKQIHEACKHMHSALYLPRTSDLRQIAKLAPKGKKVEVVQYCMEGASKALVAYVPACES